MSSIPVLHVTGDHFNVGYQVGVTFKDRIKDYFHDFVDLRNRFLPFYGTKQGLQIYEDFLNLASKSCPSYVEEVKGLAEGSGISFIEVFLMHIRSELQTYLDTQMVPECSTVYVNTTDNCLMCHNEDTSAAVQGRGYITQAGYVSSSNGAVKKQLWAYCYPGTIAGNCFGCNDRGVIITANALYPKNLQLNRLPRQFVNRLCLDADSPQHLMELIQNPSNSIASGCSVNVGWMEDTVMCNLELCPSGGQSDQSTLVNRLNVDLQTSHYVHFNMYEHMDVEQMTGRTTSSEHRKATADLLPPPTDFRSALDILGNEDDDRYPIYRTPRPTDSGCTVATGSFDLLKHRIWVHLDNPKRSLPVIEIPFPFEIKN